MSDDGVSQVPPQVTNSSTVVLVTPPHALETTEGHNLVESVKCHTIQVESRFGGEEDSKEKELQERPLSIVPDKVSEPPGGFDVCREYGYKYEYTPDDPQEEEEELDGHVSNESFQTADPLRLALHRTTAIVSQTQEKIPYIHLLGKTYHPVHEYQIRKEYEKSLFWFTYRCDFPEIVPYGIDSDAGWGCMLRSAQMLLCHTLRMHYKSRHWKPPMALDRIRTDDFVKGILTWFADFPSKTESVYSLQNMVAAGYAKYDTLPGEWYGPGSACYVLRDLVELHQQSQPNLFRVHVSSEGTVYRDAVHELMTKESKKRAEERLSSQEPPPTPLHPLDPSVPARTTPQPEDLDWDTSLLLLVPIRLGLDKFNHDYIGSIARSFCLPQSVGILGGRPRGARWFYGAYADGSKVLGLDPHTVQAAPTRDGNKIHFSDDYVQSIHTAYPEVFPIQRMDPSIAMGFYCRNKKEFTALEAALKLLKKDPTEPDLFTIGERAPDYTSSAMNEMMFESENFEEGGNRAEESDDDEYVLL